MKRRRTGFGGLPRVHGEVQGERSSAWESVFRWVRRIPRGRVMTYGQIATLLRSRLSARAVGWSLHGCPPDVPWQRVVNASGGCSTDRLPDVPSGLQRALLEREGIRFRPGGTLDLSRYRWIPAPSSSAAPRKSRALTKRGRGDAGRSGKSGRSRRKSG